MRMNSNDNLTYLKSITLDHIPNGRQNAVNCKDLAYLVGVSPRVMRKLIQYLRDDGYPICSTTSDGYWSAVLPEELNSTIKLLEHQRETIEATLESLRNTQNYLGMVEETDEY
jgi:biotin operon repressor|nr:MAG TPA: Transcriptional regulator [Caudoviricetes sp.]